MKATLKAPLAWISGFLVALALTSFVGVAMARITNPPASTAAISAIGPTGQTSDGPTTTFATSTTGTDFTITGSGDTITFNIPTASASNRGLLSTTDWSTFNAKAGLALANIFTNLNTFTQASSTLFSVNNTFYAGGSATTTIGSNGYINVAGASTTPQRSIVYNTANCVEATLTDQATVTWDLSAASCARVLLTANRTLDITNHSQAIGQAVRLNVCASGGAFSFTGLDSSIRWAGGTAPTQTATDGKCDVFAGFVSAGTSTPIIQLGASLGY